MRSRATKRITSGSGRRSPRILRAHGVVAMEIYRLGTRMTMVMDTDDACFDAARFDADARADAKIVEWEALMGAFQQPTPWTPAGVKWTPMTRIFDLSKQ